MFHKLYGFRKILELCCSSKKTVMLIDSGNALGCFTGSENVIPFSVDLSDFCRSFRVEGNTTMKIFVGYDVLLINEVHNVIERNSLCGILATIWYKIIFWTQNRMNCKLCRIIRRDLGFIVDAHRFLYKEKLFNFNNVEHWILIVSRYWWETSSVVEYVRTLKKGVAVVGNDIWRLILQSRTLLLLYDFNRLIPAFYIQIFLFWSKLQRFPYMEAVFWGLAATFNTFLFFSYLFRVISPDNLSPYQGTLFILSDLFRHAVWDVNPVKNFPNTFTVCHHEREFVPLELFSQTSTFILADKLEIKIVRS